MSNERNNEINGGVAPSISSLLKRGNLFLEDSEWKQACDYFDKVLDIDPECAPAYIGKLCAELCVNYEPDLAKQGISFDDNPDYKKALRRLEIEGYAIAVRQTINRRKNILSEIRDRNSVFRNCIAAGATHTVALKSDGTVEAVGASTSSWRDVVGIFAGVTSTIGLKADGEIVSTGNIFEDQSDVDSWKNIRTISVGAGHVIGLKLDGKVVATGINEDDECNTSDWSDVIDISAGISHSIGLKSDGTVVAVGNNDDGQCDVSGWHDIVMIAGGGLHTVGLKSDGTVVAVGDNTSNQCDVADWRDIVAIAASSVTTVGLKADGTTVLVGADNIDEDVASSVGLWENIVAISAGMAHIVGLKSDGSVVAAGRNDEGQIEVDNWRNISPPSEEKRLEQKLKDKAEKHRLKTIRERNSACKKCIAVGEAFTAALNTDGTVFTTGASTISLELHNAGSPTITGNTSTFYDTADWRDIVGISANAFSIVGVKSNGRVLVADDGTYNRGDVSKWQDVVAVAAGAFHTVGLKSDGTAIAVGDNKHGECNTAAWENIMSVSAGIEYTVGLKLDGTVVAVGRNDDGSCNTSEWSDIVAISAYGLHTVGVKSDGTVVATGLNNQGQCNLAHWVDIVDIAAGTNHTVGLKSDGTLISAGVGNATICDKWKNIIALAAGNMAIIGLKSDGTIQAIGKNDYGQCNVSNWRDIGPASEEKMKNRRNADMEKMENRRKADIEKKYNLAMQKFKELESKKKDAKTYRDLNELQVGYGNLIGEFTNMEGYADTLELSDKCKKYSEAYLGASNEQKNKNVKKYRLGFLLQGAFFTAYLAALWFTDIIRNLWIVDGFNFARMIPLAVISVTIGVIGILLKRKMDSASGILMILGLGIVQAITYCVWVGQIGFLAWRLALNLVVAVVINAISILPGLIMSIAEVEWDD